MDRVSQEILAGAILVSENMKLRYEERELRGVVRFALDSIPFSNTAINVLDRLFPRLLAFAELWIGLILHKYLFLLPRQELITSDLFPLEVLEQFDFLVKQIPEDLVDEAEKELSPETADDLTRIDTEAVDDAIIESPKETVEQLKLEISSLRDEIDTLTQDNESLTKSQLEKDDLIYDLNEELTDCRNQLTVSREFGKEQQELVSYWSSIESGYRAARSDILNYFQGRAGDSTLSSAQRWVWQNAHDYARATFYQHVNYG